MTDHGKRPEQRQVDPTAGMRIVGHKRRPASWLERYRSASAVAGAFVLVMALVASGWLLLRPEVAPGTVAAAASNTPTPTDAATTPMVSPTATPTAKPTATARARLTAKKPTPPKPRPTAKPPASELPPPPPKPEPTPTTGCPTFEGSAASADAVRTALSDAGARDYWARSGVTPPMGVDGYVDLPDMSVATELMNAIAMTESTWQSNIIACDGGVGAMQIMSGTADFIRTRFDASYDEQTLSGNTAIGAAYLEWLTVYFGIFYFGESFDLDSSAPVGDDGATVVLGDAVIAAYNVGHRAVENEHGTTDPSDDTLSIPNQWYVDRVNGYVASCPCDDF